MSGKEPKSYKGKNTGMRGFLNIGVVVFCLILAYLIYSIFAWLARDTAEAYEVLPNSSITSADTFEGLAVRQEKTVYSAASGYVNFTASEGDRVASGAIICSLDSMGDYNTYLHSGSSSQTQIAEDDYKTVASMLSDYMAKRQSDGFTYAGGMKGRIANRLISEYSIKDAQGLAALGIDSSTVNFMSSDEAGLLVCHTDGYEDIAAESVTSATFDTSDYSMDKVTSGDKVNAGDAVYKIATSEKWSIVIPLSTSQIATYQEKTSLNVEFPQENVTATVDFTIITGADGGSYGKISLSRYMSLFANDRFVTVRIDNTGESGLKIPQSAVVKLEFYVIPDFYATIDESSSDITFTAVDGEGQSVTMSPAIFAYIDGYYYIGMEDMQEGTTLVRTDSTDVWTVGTTAELTGVYNVNKGYCDFKRIEIIDENSEYCIIKDDTSDGIDAYDHILKAATEDDNGKSIY